MCKLTLIFLRDDVKPVWRSMTSFEAIIKQGLLGRRIASSIQAILEDQGPGQGLGQGIGQSVDQGHGEGQSSYKVA